LNNPTDESLVPLETDPLKEGLFADEYRSIVGIMQEAIERLRKLHEVIFLASSDDDDKLFQRIDEEKCEFEQTQDDYFELRNALESVKSPVDSLSVLRETSVAIDEIFDQVNQLSALLSPYQESVQRCLEMSNSAIVVLTQQGKYNMILSLSRLLVKLQSELDELNARQRANEIAKRQLTDAKGRLHELEMYLQTAEKPVGGEAATPHRKVIIADLRDVNNVVTELETEVSLRKKSTQQYWQTLAAHVNSHDMYEMLCFVARMSSKKRWSREVINDLAEKIEALEMALQSSVVKEV